MTIFLQASATNARTTVPTVSPVTVIGDQIAALTAIYVAGVNAVMVRRRLQSAVSAYAAQLCSQYESWRFGEVVSLTALQARLLHFLPALDGKHETRSPWLRQHGAIIGTHVNRPPAAAII